MLCGVSCLPACLPWRHSAFNPGTPPCWSISVLLGCSSRASQGQPGSCLLWEGHFVQIRMDGNRNSVLNGVTWSNLKHELISQLGTVSMSCFSLVLHCAYELMWKINSKFTLCIVQIGGTGRAAAGEAKKGG